MQRSGPGHGGEPVVPLRRSVCLPITGGVKVRQACGRCCAKASSSCLSVKNCPKGKFGFCSLRDLNRQLNCFGINVVFSFGLQECALAIMDHGSACCDECRASGQCPWRGKNSVVFIQCGHTLGTQLVALHYPSMAPSVPEHLPLLC